ncbi:MAG: hypothetical protein K5666_03630 [Bacilli bacterium]|nr:hypothetical protein [Bacilli bacterium]
MDANRWLYLENLDDGALIAERDATIAEIDRYHEELNSPYLNSSNRSEIENSDLPYEEEKLAAIEALIRERGLDRTK